MRSPAHDWSAATWYVGALALCFVGYFVPRLDFGLSDSALLFCAYCTGSVIVWLVGGRRRRKLIFVYGLYSLMGSIAFLAAAYYGARHGHTPAVFMVDRFLPRDDFTVYEWHIRPGIGARSLSLFDGETNAPLHWYVNVRVQEISVAFTGRPQLMIGNALNIVVGSITAALVVGALDLSMRPSAKRVFSSGVPIAFVLVCPWLMTSSIIAIREVWVYATFAAALYGGLAVARWRSMARMIALAAIASTCGLICYLLRAEMMPAVVALSLFAGLTVRDRPLATRSEALLAGGVIATTLLLVVPLLVLKHGTLFQEVDARNREYATLGKTLEEGQKGTVGGLVGESRVANTVLQTVWMPFQPWPRVRLPTGSTYQVGKLLMPIWLIACLSSAWMMTRRPQLARTSIEGTTWRRYRWLVVWMVAMQILVGITSSEPRHYFAILPVACCVLADMFQTRAADAKEARFFWRRGVGIAMAALALAVIVSFAAFGVDGMFPRPSFR